MNAQRLQAMAYAEGFVEDFVEEYLEGLDEETSGAKTMEQAQQLQTLWTALSTGLKELRRENAEYEMKIFQIKSIL